MPRLISLRWWLPLAFAAIAALTAVAVANVFSGRAEVAFREQAEEIAVGNGVAAAAAVNRALRRGNIAAAIPEISNRRQLALFLFDADGNLVSEPRSRRTDLDSIPFRGAAVATALAGGSFVRSFQEGRAAVVSQPLTGGGALLVYAPRPELAAGLGIAREKIVEAALWATVVGALAGLLIAWLLTARLRRIGAAAAAIEAGSFERRVGGRVFPDELGALAESIDRMRARLRESFLTISSERDRLHRLLARLREGVLTVDADLVVEDANAAAERLLGAPLPPGAPLPEPWREPSLRELTRSLFGAEAQVVQAQVTLEGDRTLSVVGLPGGLEASTAVVVVSDVTEGRRRERAQREFVANAAHEFRSPLAVISGAVEMLESGAKEDAEERDRFLAHIRRESARLGRLVRALLVMARAQSGAEPLRIDTVELEPLLRAASAASEPPAGVRLVVDCPDELRVLGQADLLEQVVGNLLDNARKHTEQGEIRLSARAEDGAVLVEVADTGKGIRAGELESVFDRFYRGGGRGADGFGLGLAIVREAVRALGGDVEISSRVGRGTTVRVRLRPAPSPAEVAA